MVDYSNKVFKPSKDSGFVIKFRLIPDKADETQKDREQNIDKCHSTFVKHSILFQALKIHLTISLNPGILKTSLHSFTK